MKNEKVKELLEEYFGGKAPKDIFTNPDYICTLKVNYVTK